jgi:hypothetical protein
MTARRDRQGPTRLTRFPQFPEGRLCCSFAIVEAAADGDPVQATWVGRIKSLQEQNASGLVDHQHATCLARGWFLGLHQHRLSLCFTVLVGA